jgi:hypothetical protein
MKDSTLALAQAFASRIAALPDKHQDELMQESSFDITELAQHTRSVLLNALDANESPLKIARREIDMLAAGKKQRASDMITDPRSYLIDMMVKGLLPNDLTLAFRNGKELSDDDLRSIIDDLEDLGDDLDGDY